MAPPLIQLKDIRADLRRHAAVVGRRTVGVGGRTRVPGRPQRLRQIDAAEDRRRPGRARQRQPLRAAGRDHPLSAAGARSLPVSPPRSPMSRPASAPATIAIGPAICWSSSACTATKTRRSSPAAKPAARRWRACWRPSPTFCCWTSRPTISISPPSNGWRPSSTAAARRSSSSATTVASSRTCRGRPCGSIAARRGGSSRGFAAFEAWRDEVLAEEELEQHKLDRKIVDEEHWVRYGVTGAAQAQRQAARQSARAARSSGATIAARRQRQPRRGGGGKIRQAGDRGQEHLQEPMATARSSTASRSASSAATASASSARTAPARRRC